MADLKERVSYLQGLIEGLEIGEGTKEGKAIKVIADVLREIAQAVEELVEAQEDTQDYIDSIDEDLADLEQEVYGDDFVEVECPNCGEALEIEESVLDDLDTEIVCPECGESFICEELDDFMDLDGFEIDEDDEGEQGEGETCCQQDDKCKLHPVK